MSITTVHKVDNIDGAYIVLRGDSIAGKVGIEPVLVCVSPPELNDLPQLGKILAVVFNAVRRALIGEVGLSVEKLFFDEIHRKFREQRRVIWFAGLISRQETSRQKIDAHLVENLA